MIFKQGVLPPTEKLTLSIFPTPAWPVKSPLIRRLSFGAQWLHTSVCAHRAPKLKPPSERQFDRPRQKLASLVSRLLKKGQSPFRLRLSPILLQKLLRSFCGIVACRSRLCRSCCRGGYSPPRAPPAQIGSCRLGAEKQKGKTKKSSLFVFACLFLAMLGLFFFEMLFQVF